MTPCQITKGRRQLQRDNLAMARAKFAVLGFCSPSPSFSPNGVNLVSDVAQTQARAGGYSSVAAPGAVFNGAGGLTAADTTQGPTVYDMGQGGAIPAPDYPSLTTVQGPSVPVVPVPVSALPRFSSCPNASVVALTPGGAAWGSSSASRGPLMASGFLGIPIAGWLALGGLAALAVGTRGRN